MKRILLAMTLVSSLAANDTAKPAATHVYDAKSAFEYLKSLAGVWEKMGGESDHEGGAQSTVTFRVSAAGSAVIQTYFAGLPNEMVSVYHMNGPDLMMTHYCALQNAPVMKFEKTGKPGEIKMGFAGGSNFDPKVDAHAHEGLIRVRDRDTYEATAIGWSGGKPNAARVSVMKRKR